MKNPRRTLSAAAPVKPAWSSRYFGYRAFDHDIGGYFVIIASSKQELRAVHKRLFPTQPFKPKLCHPAQMRRVK